MTVAEQVPTTSVIANGVTTIFPYHFMVSEAGDIGVTNNGVAVLSGFSVSGAGVSSGGNVTFSIPPSNGNEIVIYRKLALSRQTDYQQFGDWLAPTVNPDFDRVWLMMQVLSSVALRVPVGDSESSGMILPPPSERALRTLGFGADGRFALFTPEYGPLTDASSISYLPNYAGAISASASSRLDKMIFSSLFTAGGTADDTDGVLAFFAAMQSSGRPGTWLGGRYTLREGEVGWAIGNGVPDSPGPTLYTAGEVVLVAKGVADAPLLSIHNYEANGDGGFINGGYLGPLKFEDTTADGAVNRHGLELFGVQGMHFPHLHSDDLQGDLVHLKSVGTATTADQWHVNACHFDFVRAFGIGGWAFNNNTVSQAFTGSYIGIIWAIGDTLTGKGAYRKAGSNIVIGNISVSATKGWAVDLTPDVGSVTGFEIHNLELDAPERGIRVSGVLGFDIKACRITYRYDESGLTPALTCWPLTGCRIGEVADARTTSGGKIAIIHRMATSITAGTVSNVGKMVTLDNHNLVSNVVVDNIVNYSVGGYTIPDSDLREDVNANSLGILIRNESKVIHDSQIKNILRARQLVAAVIDATGAGGYVTVPYPSEVVDDGNNYDTGTYRYTVPSVRYYNIRAQISLSGLTAGNLVRMAIVRNSLGVDSFLSESHAYAYGAGVQTFTVEAITESVLTGDTIRIEASQNSGASKSTAAGISYESTNRFEITPILG